MTDFFLNYYWKNHSFDNNISFISFNVLSLTFEGQLGMSFGGFCYGT